MEYTPEYETKNLLHKFQMMKNLPAVGYLPAAKHLSDRKLLDELLELDTESPIEYLEENESRLAARVLYWYALDNLRQLLHAAQFADIHLKKADGYFTDFNFQLIEPLVGTHPTVIHEDVLNEVFYDLKQSLKFPLVLPPSAEKDRNSWLHMLHQLFQLPDNTSPLEWIQAEKTTAALRCTLRHLMKQVTPSENIWLSDDVKVQQINQPIKIGLLKINLEKIVHKQQGFIIHFKFGLPRQLYSDVMHHSSAHFFDPNWLAITSITDSQNQNYIVYRFHYERGKILRKSKLYHLRLPDVHFSYWCYPALPHNPTTLTINCQETSFELSAVHVASGRIIRDSLYEQLVDSLYWRIHLQ